MANKRDLQMLRELEQDMSPNLARTRSMFASMGKIFSNLVGQRPTDGTRFRLNSDFVVTSSGNTVTASPSGSARISLYGDLGWNDYDFLQTITLDTTGFVAGKKYSIFINYDQSNSTEDLTALVLTAIEWVDEITLGFTPLIQDGTTLNDADPSYRCVRTGRYNGSSMWVPGSDEMGMTWYGTGDPNDPTGPDPFTGMILNADGLFGYNAGVLQTEINNLGQIYAAALQVWLDANGLNINVPTAFANTNAIVFRKSGSVHSALYAYDPGSGGEADIVMRINLSSSGLNQSSPAAAGVVALAKSGFDAHSDLVAARDGGATARIRVLASGAGQSIIHVNYDVSNVDMQVHGGSDDNLIYTDASANRVGIGNNAPTEKLDVTGNIKASGTIAASNVNGSNSGDVSIGAQASGLSIAGQVLSLSPTGWTEANETWTQVTASTFTCPTDQTARYKKGTFIKWTQTGVRYGVVAIDATFAAGVTTVTIIVNTDYTLAAAAISANFYTYDISPLGWPGWFNWAPTVTGYGTPPAGSVFRYKPTAGSIRLATRDNAAATSNATTISYTLPVTAKTITSAAWVGAASAIDNGVSLTAPALASVVSAATVLNIFKDFSGAAWTNTGNKRIPTLEIEYEY